MPNGPVTFYGGGDLDEEIMYIDEGTLEEGKSNEGKSMTVAVIRSSIPLKDWQVVFGVEAVAADKTKMTMDMDYKPKFGPLGWLLNVTLMRRKLANGMPDLILGLEKHLATGGAYR